MSRRYKFTDEELPEYLKALNIREDRIENIMNDPIKKNSFIDQINDVMDVAVTWKKAFDPNLTLKNGKLTPEEIRECFVGMNQIKQNGYQKR